MGLYPVVKRGKEIRSRTQNINKEMAKGICWGFYNSKSWQENSHMCLNIAKN